MEVLTSARCYKLNGVDTAALLDAGVLSRHGEFARIVNRRLVRNEPARADVVVLNVQAVTAVVRRRRALSVDRVGRRVGTRDQIQKAQRVPRI